MGRENEQALVRNDGALATGLAGAFDGNGESDAGSVGIVKYVAAIYLKSI